MTKSFFPVIGGEDLMRRSRMTTIATIAAAVSFGSRRLMKSTFRPDFDSNSLQIIWDREFGFLKETLVAPVPRVAIMLGRTFGGATAATLQGCIVLFLALFFVFTRIVGC